MSILKQKNILLFLVSSCYICLSLLVFICPINIPIINFIPGMLFMWVIYVFFYLGVKSITVKNKPYGSVVFAVKKQTFLYILTFCFVLFYPFYIHFYTGLSVTQSLYNVLHGGGNYHLYQNYFKESGLSKFTILKLPYIVFNGLLKFFYICSVIKILVYSKKPSTKEKFCLTLMTLILLFVGISRGTSFELFEIVVLLTYTFFVRRNYFLKKLLTVQDLVILIFIALAGGLYFALNIAMRNNQSFVEMGNNIDVESLIYKISPTIAVILYSLYGYFLFGIHLSSVILVNVWGRSLIYFFSILIPHGLLLLGLKNVRVACKPFIDMGARWMPDMMLFLDSFGLFFFFGFVFYIGRISSKLSNKSSLNFFRNIVYYYCFYIMFSLPIGNFITTSSANLISLVLSILFFKTRRMDLITGRYFLIKTINITN